MKKGLSRFVLADEIYSILKRQINTHELTAGSKINIDQLARDLEVSNIPIREALTRLSAEGLVQTVPFKGMFVMNMSIKELDEIYELRIALESTAVRKSVQVIPEEELDSLVRQMKLWAVSDNLGMEEKLELVSLLNDGLHGMILKHCGNEMLSMLIHTYIERIQRYLSYVHYDIESEFVQLEWQEHMAIISGLVARDAERSVSTMKAHLEASRARTHAALIDLVSEGDFETKV